MAEKGKGVSLVILGIVAIVGLVLLFAGKPTPAAAQIADVPAETFRNQLIAEAERLLRLLDLGARLDGGLPAEQTWTLNFGSFSQSSLVGFVWTVLSRNGKVLERPWASLFVDEDGQVTGTPGAAYIVLGIAGPGGESTWALFALTDITTNPAMDITTITFTLFKTGLSLEEAGVHTVVADEMILLPVIPLSQAEADALACALYDRLSLQPRLHSQLEDMKYASATAIWAFEINGHLGAYPPGCFSSEDRSGFFR